MAFLEQLEKAQASGQKPKFPHKLPPLETFEAINEMWIDTSFKVPSGIWYGLYDQPTRGPGAKGSYLVSLPENYDEDVSTRYPILFWLHGGMSFASSGIWALQHYASAQREGLMPKTIVISVQALPTGWYINSKDGSRKIEDVIVNDLVPAVHRRYRTIGTRESVGVEGFSMGGYGALHLGLNNPEVFGAISAIAPAIIADMNREPPQFVQYTFFGDHEYYKANHPITLAEKNGDRLRGRTHVRLLAGSDDTRLTQPIADLHAIFERYNIPHKLLTIDKVDHQYEDILRGAGDYASTYWADALTHKL